MKNNSIVIFEVNKELEKDYPFKNGESFLFLGEITNMRGHCIIVNRQGKVFWGYHIDNFRKPTEDEL